MKKLIKAILITGVCVSSVSSMSGMFCEDETISPCPGSKHESVPLCDICDFLGLTKKYEKPGRVKLTKGNLYELLYRVNKSAKAGEKIKVEKLLSGLQVKEGYIYYRLSFINSKSGEYETFILGSNNSSIYDGIFIINLRQEGK
jgi:hypothetical protein